MVFLNEFIYRPKTALDGYQAGETADIREMT
jgi:hypothetical protein